MDIEQIFQRRFSTLRKQPPRREHGLPGTVSDMVAGALCDLWQYDSARAQAVADKVGLLRR
jgi:hypothetical protein